MQETLMRFWAALWILASLFLNTTSYDPGHDREFLLALHARERQAHLKGAADLLATEMADQVVNVEYGKVEFLTRNEMRRQFAEYFGRVKYASWDDIVEPRVSISPDGHMAWTVIQVKARLSDVSGARAGQSREFTSSWISTYEKRRADWQMVGISSGIAEGK
jgi:hypothetical protein